MQQATSATTTTTTTATPAIPGLDHALEIASRAANDVPAYADHLRRHGLDPEQISSIELGQLPIITKQNYLSVHPRNQLMWDGDITGAGTWSTSSGSNGEPSYWPRELVSLEESVRFYDRIFRANFHSQHRKTLVVNGFAMGTWIGGTYTYLALLCLRGRGHRLSVITPGIDADAIIRAISHLGPFYDQVVIAGYPPFIRDVLDRAPADVLDQDIKILLAGEAITETWRDYILERLGKRGRPEQICLMYGTADAGVMGYESPLTTAVRRAAGADLLLGKDLFGDHMSVQPTFVEYEPDARFVEVDEEGFLLFTIDTSVPLIRYRLNDRGRTINGSQLREMLLNRGHTHLARQVDPLAAFLVLEGRPDVAATFHSLNIYPENLHPAFENPSVADVLTGKFVIRTPVDSNQASRLCVHAELRPRVQPAGRIRETLEMLCLASLIATNHEYRALHRSNGDAAAPTVSLHPYGSKDFTPDTKHRWTGDS